MKSYSGVEVFKIEDGKVLPGEDWSTTLTLVRRRGRMTGRKDEVSKLGLILSGIVLGKAVVGKADLEVNLADFAGAARPPMNEQETARLYFGYMNGNAILGNMVGPHIPSDPGEIVGTTQQSISPIAQEQN